MKKVLKHILAFFVGIGIALAFFAGRLFKSRSGEKAFAENEQKKYEEVKNEIQNTPAGDLVDSAPNADELRSNAAGIAENAKQRLRDRVGRILSG